MMLDCRGFFNALIRFIISKTDFNEPEILPYLIHFAVPSNLADTGGGDRGGGGAAAPLPLRRPRRAGPGAPRALRSVASSFPSVVDY